MSILFDLTPIQTSYGGNYNGASEYCYSLFRKLVESGNSGEISAVFDSNRGLQEKVTEILTKNGFMLYPYSNHVELSSIVNKHKIFYSAEPYNLYDLKLNNDVLFIYTVHGLRDIEITSDSMMGKYEPGLKSVIKLMLDKFYPDYLSERAKRKFEHLFNVTYNRKIITDSYHTKYSILARFDNIKPFEISVYYAPSKNSYVFNEKKNSKKDYILMVSGNRWIKNNLRAALAIDHLISRNKLSNQVIITGVKNQNIYLDRLKNKENFVLEGYLEEDELEKLYAEAKLFVYPTLNEGFGYPPIEAMKYGTVCVCAADTSIPEICGGAVMYFNPYDINEIETRILQGLSIECREGYCEKMRERFGEISARQQEDLDKLALLIMNGKDM